MMCPYHPCTRVAGHRGPCGPGRGRHDNQRGGRPRSGAEPRDVAVSIRVSATEMALLTELRGDLSPGDYLLRCARIRA